MLCDTIESDAGTNWKTFHWPNYEHASEGSRKSTVLVFLIVQRWLIV